MQEQAHFYKYILPIVVLYKQTLEESATLRSLNAALVSLDFKMDIFIYDNSPDPVSNKSMFTWKQFQVSYFHDPLNSGLSKAYNMGAAKAAESGKTWLLLLDQDTSFDAGVLDKYWKAISENPAIKIFAPILKLTNGLIFSPCLNKHKRGYPLTQVSPGVHRLKKIVPVNSGMLVQLNLFEQVGGYNEKVKLDFSDFQFLERVQKKESFFFVVDSIALQDFSSEEISVEKQIRRFNSYLADARNAHKDNLADKIGFLYTVTRHSIGLTLKMKRLSFMKYYVKNYLLNR